MAFVRVLARYSITTKAEEFGRNVYPKPYPTTSSIQTLLLLSTRNKRQLGEIQAEVGLG
jgi:hypothetical protein